MASARGSNDQKSEHGDDQDEKRTRKPVKRLTYDEEGKQMSKVFSQYSGSMKSARSEKTAESKKKLEDLNLEHQLLQLERDHKKAKNKLMDDLAELEQLLEAGHTPTDADKIQFDIKKIKKNLERIERDFVDEKKYLESKCEIQKKIITEKEEGDCVSQYLSSDEENCDRRRGPQDKYVDPYHEDPDVPERDPIAALATAMSKCMGKGKPKDLPEFDGKAEEWPVFISEFDRTTKEFHISDSANLIRLRKALLGSAKDAVSGLIDDPSCIQEIIEILRERFGRPEFIIGDLIKKVKEAKAPEVNKPETVVNFGTIVQNLVCRIKSLKKPKYLYDVTLLNELVKKLPTQYAENWITWVTEDSNRDEDLEFFGKWMKTRVVISQRLYQPSVSDKKDLSRGRNRREGVLATVERKCDHCDSESHYIWKCDLFKNLTLDERKKVASSKSLCYVCLGNDHKSFNCESEWTCRKNGCGERHHTLLHGDQRKSFRKRSEVSRDPSNEDDQPSGSEVTAAAAGKGRLPIIPVIIKGPGGTETVYALLDSCSSRTLIEKNLAKKIGLSGKESTLSFVTVGNETRNEKSSEVEFEIRGVGSCASYFPVKKAGTIPNIGLPSVSVDVRRLKEENPHLRRMKMRSIKNGVAKLILGYDHHVLYASREILENKSDLSKPTAYRGLLGWYVCESEEAKVVINVICCAVDPIDSLHQQVNDFFSLEHFGVINREDSCRSKEDKLALDQMEKSTKKVDGRWETCLLRRDGDAIFPPSYESAKKRLYGMERKMDRDPEFAKLVMEKLDDYIGKGYLEEVQSTDHNQRWFLPWFFAYHPSKKPRLVFDAASKVQGKSLNDHLLKGPDLLRPLPAVLMRYRRHQVALTADIKEMFHQIKLLPSDRVSQTILYRGMDRSIAPRHFEMTRLFFGSASSPSSAIYSKNKNAEMFSKTYPKAVTATLLDSYMDDYLTGCDSSEEAVKLFHELKYIHDEGSFPLVKWNSNSDQVLKAIPEDIRAVGPIDFHSKTEVTTEKTLGLVWDHAKDEFGFYLQFLKIPKDVVSGETIPTKRQVAGLVMAIFDPLGFLCPIKMKGLSVMQQTWKTKIGWDDQVPASLFDDWKSWLEDVKDIVNVKIPRKISPVTLSDLKSIQLHVFCDASLEGYAAVAYLRLDTGGNVFTPFVFGKARVAPLKCTTVPRLELQAALMGVRMASMIKETYHEIKFGKEVFWIDSRTVLSWIRSTEAKFKMFVGNRIAEIWESTAVENFRWVPTALNAADDSTRTKDAKVSSDCRWLTCSEFVRLPEINWPVERKHDQELENPEIQSELSEIVLAVVEDEIPRFTLPDVERFSWFKLLRIVATAFVFLRRYYKREPRSLTWDDMKRAQRLFIIESQKRSFPEELRDLTAGKELDKSSRLYALNVKLDQNGILVMSSRIQNANVSWEVKNPPILCPNDRFTRRMILWFHESSDHFGQERQINELRQQAWILNCRGAVRRCKLECSKCQRDGAKPEFPQMGQLPFARLEKGTYPFHHTGVDYFGPLFVKNKRCIEKVWGVIYTCMTTRAVHLDLVDSLDSSDMIDSLVRLSNLRGVPAHVWSDNGTCFVGGEREIRESLETWNKEDVKRKLFRRGIEWHFIPPASPHMGGNWERQIRSVKRILNVILKEQHPRKSTLLTMLSEVTYMMNSRPLTRASPDPRDMECLTPNHFLNIRCVIGPSVPGEFCDERYQKSWRYAQWLSRHFWDRWSKEYLPWLASRQKWIKPVTPLKEGDVVIVLEDNACRNAWKTGVIVGVTRAKDGQVRSADVKIASCDRSNPEKSVRVSVIKRPAAKICPLRFGEGSE